MSINCHEFQLILFPNFQEDGGILGNGLAIRQFGVYRL